MTNAQMVSTRAWRFHLVDINTASTNYAVEYRSTLAPTNVWKPATNVTALGGGVFEVALGPPQPRLGFYRAKGFRMLMAGFNSDAATVEEGGGTAGPVLVFNSVYTGWVTNTWTDAQGVSWTNQTWVNGTTAVIPVPDQYLTDNANIGRLSYLTLQLAGGQGLGLGATTRSKVTIEENDAEWLGVLQMPGATVDFGLTLLQTNGGYWGQIQSDGFGFFPTNALAQLNFTADTFTLVATNIPLPTLTAYPPLGFTNYLDLRLDAANGPGSPSVTWTAILGVATLVSKVPNRDYLDAGLSGPFQLLKLRTAASTNDVPLQPVP
jgi:hypothetical protein